MVDELLTLSLGWGGVDVDLEVEMDDDVESDPCPADDSLSAERNMMEMMIGDEKGDKTWKSMSQGMSQF